MAYGYRDKIANGTIEFGVYMKKRIKHIWPLMFITLIVVLIEELIYRGLTGRFFVYQEFNLWYFILNLFMIQYGWFDTKFSFNGPAWCIPVEILCYILCYAVLAMAVGITCYVKNYEWFGNFQLAFIYVLAPCFRWIAINSKWLRYVLEFKPFICLGKCSLSIFLWHFPVQYAIKIIDSYFELGINYLSISFFFVYVSAVLVMSAFSRKFIETRNVDILKLLVRY